MKFSQLLFLGSVATPGLALVPAARYQALGSPDAGTDSAFSARGRDVPGGALRVRAGIQYDNYLPELPAGWPNMSMSTAPSPMSGVMVSSMMANRAASCCETRHKRRY